MAQLPRPAAEIPPPGRLGRITRAPDALGAPFEAVVPSYEGDLAYSIERWQSRGLTLPAAGDEVLVVVDERGEPWVPVWWPSGGDLPPTDGDAVHDGDAAGGQVGGTFPDNLTVPGVVTAINAQRDHGAAGDGVADDTAELQAAISAAAAGGLVYIPEGTYRITSALSVPYGVQILGAGYGTLIHCAGDHYAFRFNEGIWTGVASLRVEADAEQAAGGAFDFTDAETDVRIDDVYIGSNVHTAFNMAPNEIGGHYWVSRVKFIGSGTGRTYGFVIGDGTNLVTDIKLQGILGQCPPGEIDTWMLIRNNTDSIHLSDVAFYQGDNGIVIGESASNTVSEMKAINCYVDGMAHEAISAVKCRNVEIIDCACSGNGSSSEAAVAVGASAVAFQLIGGVVQQNDGDGVSIADGALHTVIDGVIISDNNTSDTASRHGISIAAGADHFRVNGCLIGNNLMLATGHQKYGLAIGSGASDNYRLTNNSFSGNETGALSDGGSGTSKVILGNLPTTINDWHLADAVVGDLNVAGVVNVIDTAGGFYQRVASHAGLWVYASAINGESTDRHRVQADGAHLWGSGSADPDTNLYRGAADQLRTDDDLLVGGEVGFNGQAPAARPDYTVTNGATDRAFDADATSINELADVLATLISDLQAIGLLQ